MSHNQDLEKALELISKKQSRIDQLQAENAELKAEREEYLEWKKTWLESFDTMQSDLISVKAERDKHKSIVDRLPKIEELVLIASENFNYEEVGDATTSIINIAKAIYDRIQEVCSETRSEG